MFRCSYTIFREITSCVSWSYELLKKYSTAVVILYTVFRNDYRGFNNLYIQYTWDSSICIFLFNRTTLQVFVTYLTGALYVHPLWFYKHQQDNRVHSKLLHASSDGFNGCYDSYLQFRDTCGKRRNMELSDGGCFANLVRNCRWTIVTDRHSWNVSTQNAFSLSFAAIPVNCSPSGEMRNYWTPHIIKENFENFFIHRCNYILLCQVYCVWQVVKTQGIIFNNPVYCVWNK